MHNFIKILFIVTIIFSFNSFASDNMVENKSAPEKIISNQISLLTSSEQKTLFLLKNNKKENELSEQAKNEADKNKRFEKLKERIKNTYGFRLGRMGILSPSIGPKLDKLYSLKKIISDADWILLVETYLYSGRKEMRDLKFQSAVRILVAMREKFSIEIINIYAESSSNKQENFSH